MSHCQRRIEAQRYHDGELSPAERADFERHAAECPSCARELDELRRLAADMRTTFGAVGVPRDTVARWCTSAREQAEAAALIRLAVSGMSAAAAILLLCSAMLWQAWFQPAPATRTDLALENLAVIAPNEDIGETSDEARLAQWIVADLSRAHGHD